MARRGQEGGRVLGLGGQWEAGRGDGAGTDPAVHIVTCGWAGGSVELRETAGCQGGSRYLAS